MTPAAQAQAAASDAWQQAFATPADAVIHIGANTGNTANTCAVKIKRMKIQIRY